MNDVSNTRNAFEVSILRVRERFIERAYQQAQELDLLMDRIEGNPEDQAARARVASIAHKISGVAKTLGFETVGRLAQKAECDLNSQGNEVALDVVDALVEELDLIVSSESG